MPNFSQSLAQYSQAVANRKTRREIKKQQEEAAAAARSAQNARSNRGFMGTLGGAAAAVGVGAMTGWNPATMAMAYQAGSALGSGANSIVKPYNQQEVRGMAYTQPSGWETFNQVAPAVGSAYGAYQTGQQQQQQSDYNNQLNNLLKMHQIMDMNPAATTGMINQLNSDHTKKYELDGKQPYMFDMGASSGVSTDQFNYSKNKKQWDSALKTHIDNGDTGWILANHDSEMWDRNPYLTRDDAMAMANRNRKANIATAQYKANAETRAEEKHDMAVTGYTQSQADRMIEPFVESIKVANNEKDLLRLSENFDEEFSKNLTQNQKALLSNQLSAKYYEVVQKPRQEEYKAELKELVKQVNSQTQPVSKKEFMAVAVDKAQLHPDVAEGMWVAAHNKSAQERDDKFLAKASSVDLWNRDLLGREIKREPEVVREQVAYMWEVMGASNDSLHQAYEALGVLKKGEAGGGGHGEDVSDKVTMMNMGDGELQAIDIPPGGFNSTGGLKEDVNQRVPRHNFIQQQQFTPQYLPQSQQGQQGQQGQQSTINRQQWEEMNNPPTFQQSSGGNQNAAWLEMQAGKQDGPPAAQRTEGGPAAVAQDTAIATGASGPPADEDADPLTGNPYAQGTATDQQYAAALKNILEKSKAKTSPSTSLIGLDEEVGKKPERYRSAPPKDTLVPFGLSDPAVNQILMEYGSGSRR